MIAAGKMDRRITLQRVVETRDSASGEVVETGEELAQVWAQREPLRATERFQASQFAAKADTRFRIRYRTGVEPKGMRILADDGRLYDITGVLEHGRKEELEILAWARAEG